MSNPTPEQMQTDFPAGNLREYNLWNIIIQGNDMIFDEASDCWRRVPRHWIGLVAARVVPYYTHVHGPLIRLSDAVHACNFKGKYGIDKPDSLVPREDNPLYRRGEL